MKNKSQKLSSPEEYKTKVRNIFKKLRAIYQSSNPNTFAEINPLIAQMNALYYAKDDEEPAILSYLIMESPHTEDDIAFLDFLLTNGLQTQFLEPFSPNLIIWVCQNQHFLLLKWLLEKCHLIILPTKKNHPLYFTSQFADRTMFNYLVDVIQKHTLSHDSALIMAAYGNQVELFKLLVEEYQLDINQPNSFGDTPLMIAAEEGADKIVAYILQRNEVDLTYKNHKGLTAFHCALSETNLRPLCQLIAAFEKQQHSLESIKDENGCNLLHWAIGRNLPIAAQILSKKINPRLPDPHGFNLAIHALAHKKIPLAEKLIKEYGFDIREISNNGLNALHYCILNRAIYSIEWLIYDQHIDLEERTPDGDTSLLLAAKKNQPVICDKFLFTLKENKTVDVNVINNEGNGLGYYLALHNQHELIQDLFKQNRLNIAQRNLQYETMLDIALEKGTSHAQTVEICIKHLQKKHSKGIHPLSLLKIKQFTKLLEFFCSETHDIEPWIENGHQAIHIACLKGDPTIIEGLINQFKLDVNQPNQAGDTPLSLLVKNGAIRLAIWFCQTFKPKLTNLDSRNLSLLQLACEQQNLKLVKWRVSQNKAEILKKRNQGLSALDIAIDQQDATIINYLWEQLNASERENYIQKANEIRVEYLMTLNLYAKPVVAKIVSTPPMESSPLNALVSTQALSPQPTTLVGEHLSCNQEQLFEAIESHQVAFIKKLKDKKLTNRQELDALLQSCANEAIQRAIEKGDSQILYQLLHNRAIQENVARNDQVWLILAIQKQFTEGVRVLLNHLEIKKSAHQHNNAPLRTACELNSLAIVVLLLNIPAIKNSAHEPEARILFTTANAEQDDNLRQLLLIESLRDEAHQNHNEALCAAITKDNMDIVKIFLPLENVQSQLAKDNFNALDLAVANECNEIVAYFLTYTKIKEHIQFQSNQQITYNINVQQNTEETIALFPPNYVHYWPIYQYPHLPIDPLIIYPVSSVYFNEELYNTFYAAVEHGDMLMVNQLLQTQSVMHQYAATYCTQLCILAILNDNPDILKVLFSSPGVFQQVTHQNNLLFRIAAKNGKINCVIFLFTMPQVYEQASIFDNYALRMAARRGHWNVVDFLLNNHPEIKQLANIYNNYALKKAIYYGHSLVAYRLLENLNVFRQAAKRPRADSLQPILDEFVAFKINNPPVQFTYEQSHLYFLIIRYCIQENRIEFNSKLTELLNLPALKKIAHLSFSSRYENNQLLQVAYQATNTTAVDILLSIPHVRDMANSTNPSVISDARHSTFFKAQSDSNESPQAAQKADNQPPNEEKLIIPTCSPILF